MHNNKEIPPVEERYSIGGKINLFLKITGKKENGYHELLTFFIPLPEPSDVLFIKKTSTRGIRIQCDAPGIDQENNTLTKAYRLFSDTSKLDFGAIVRLVKKIPHGAGLGGGSADAAVLLNWLNTNAPNPIPESSLRSLAARVGADVPFFLTKQPCLAEGIGDILSPMPHGLEKSFCVLLCPLIHIDTAWAFKKWDSENLNLTAGAKMSKKTLSRLRELYGNNDFESLVFHEFPIIAEIKKRLDSFVPVISSLSGTGSSMYGIFSDELTAKKAVTFFQENVPSYGPFQI